jgi:hypothetical protein
MTEGGWAAWNFQRNPCCFVIGRGGNTDRASDTGRGSHAGPRAVTNWANTKHDRLSAFRVRTSRSTRQALGLGVSARASPRRPASSRHGMPPARCWSCMAAVPAHRLHIKCVIGHCAAEGPAAVQSTKNRPSACRPWGLAGRRVRTRATSAQIRG